MTNLRAFALGYFIGADDTRHRAASCCKSDVYNIGPSIETDIRSIHLTEPIVNDAGGILVRCRERGSTTDVCPPDPDRIYMVEWKWLNDSGTAFGSTGTVLFGHDLDERFPGWHAIAEVLPGRPPPGRVTPPPAAAGASSESEEPAEGFKARAIKKVWGMMWAAGYDLPNPEKFVDPVHAESWCIVRVLAGPFRGLNVCVCERAGPWAVCELGVSHENQPNEYCAVRLRDLEKYAAVFDAEGNPCPVKPQPNTAVRGVLSAGGNPETHPCV